MPLEWTRDRNSEFIDVHKELLPYSKVRTLLRTVHDEFDVLKYCNGANSGGRFIFQILCKEFVEQLTDIINQAIGTSEETGILLEVMGGDGKLSEFLKPKVHWKIVVTDSKRDAHDIAYPKWIIKEDAMDAVRKYTPSIVIISWEPLLSSVGFEIVEMGVPLIWIGDPKYCGVDSGLLKVTHERVRSKYALGRRDDFGIGDYGTDIYLFNWT